MRFLTSLFWIVIAVLVAGFAIENWRDVTINLWGDLQADVKVPILLAIVFFLGFLPAYGLHRVRLWRLHRERPLGPTPRTQSPVGEEELA